MRERIVVSPVVSGVERMEMAFHRAFPEYASTGALDDLRAREFRRLDDADQVCLDYTGGGLYADAQFAEHAAPSKGYVTPLGKLRSISLGLFAQHPKPSLTAGPAKVLVGLA